MGRSSFRTVLDMVTLVFVLSESSQLENPLSFAQHSQRNAHPRILFHSQ